MEFLKNPNYDFESKARYFIGLSIFFIVSGLAVMSTRGVNYGVEFSGGTQLIVQFQKPPDVDKIRQAVDRVTRGAAIQTYGDASSDKVLIRIAGEETAPVNPAAKKTETTPTPETLPAAETKTPAAETKTPAAESKTSEPELDAQANKAIAALAANYAENPVVEHSSEIVGPVVGAELRQKAVLLTVLGLAFQLIYIAVRFKGGIWGVAAAVASLHDVLICVGFLTFFQYEITLNVIAALLTLVGYSVNDTIVIFDRARENLRQRRKERLGKVLNDSVNQTLTRTLIANGTTFLAVLGLYLFGGEVLRGFGFTMVIGILVGTYSTVFIAVPIVVWWYEYSQKRQGPPATKAA
jgi:preprotein translocase subunit SecF